VLYDYWFDAIDLRCVGGLVSLLVSSLSEKLTVHLLEAEHFHWLVGVRKRVDVPVSFVSILLSSMIALRRQKA
jgi:hypothetical protein